MVKEAFACFQCQHCMACLSMCRTTSKNGRRESHFEFVSLAHDDFKDHTETGESMQALLPIIHSIVKLASRIDRLWFEDAFQALKGLREMQGLEHTELCGAFSELIHTIAGAVEIFFSHVIMGEPLVCPRVLKEELAKLPARTKVSSFAKELKVDQRGFLPCIKEIAEGSILDRAVVQKRSHPRHPLAHTMTAGWIMREICDFGDWSCILGRDGVALTAVEVEIIGYHVAKVNDCSF